MTGWTQCPNCQLKHTARPDGLCPRCRLPLSAAAPPAAEILPTVPAPPVAPQDPAAVALPTTFPAPPPPVTVRPFRTLAPQGAQLTVGRLLSDAFSTWSKDAGVIVPLVLLANVAPIVAIVRAWGRFAVEPTGDKLFTSGAYWAAMGINLLINPVELFGVAHAGVRRLSGTPASFGELVLASLRGYFPALATWVLLLLAVAGTSCTVVVPAILLAAWAAALPAMSKEGLGPIAALRRSWHLSKGHRGSIFGTIAVLELIVAAAAWTAKAVLALVAHRGHAGVVTGLTAGMLEGVSLLFQSIGSSILTTSTAVVYWRLREEKEGADALHLGRVFE